MVVSLGVATCAALVKTKQEIDTSRAEMQAATKDPWVGNDSVKWVELAAEHNPSLWLPSPRDIAEKRDPVRPMREPIEAPARSDMTLRWGSAPFACELTNERSAREDGEQFATRAGSDAASMLRAFPAR